MFARKHILFITRLAQLWAYECFLVFPATAIVLNARDRFDINELSDVGHSAEELQEFDEYHVLSALIVSVHILYGDF